MAFEQNEVDVFLSDVGRRCCICGKLHSVQLHHIVPKSEGGSDDINNAIALCPNCHNEVHSSSASGRVTRKYTAGELKLHRENAIERTRKAQAWAPGTPEFESDKELILFYAQSLDRPAFQTPFHMELSFSDFDRAIEDTMLVLNTGYWRTQDGDVINRAQGKIRVVNPKWREMLDEAVEKLELIRSVLRRSLGLDGMMFTTPYDREFLMEREFRNNAELRMEIDSLRNEVITIFNNMLGELGQQPLKTIPV